MTRRSVPLLLALALLPAPVARAGAAPVPSFEVTKQPDGDQVVRFDRRVRNVTASNLVLREDGVSLPGRIACRTARGKTTSCATGSVRTVRFDPDDVLVPGQRYRLSVNPDGVPPITGHDGTAARSKGASFRVSLFAQERGPATEASWRPASVGGIAMRRERARNAAADAWFTGSRVDLFTVEGPKEGRAEILVDGERVAILDNYAPDRAAVRRRFRRLGDGSHRITVRVLGRRDDRSRGKWITIDGFEASGEVRRERFSWAIREDDAAAKGAYARSSAAGASIAFTFRGKGVDWYTVTGPSMGKADVYIDGELHETVDNYAPATAYGVPRSIAGLRDEVHRLEVRVAGERSDASSGNAVAVDRFAVRVPKIGLYRDLGAWVDLFDGAADPAESAADMASHGVETLYLQTARYNSGADIADPAWASEWIEAAHANGIKIVGWYLPAYDEHMKKDVRRTVAISTFVSTNGQRFDSLAVDIEYRGETETRAEFMDGVAIHLRRVRNKVGNRYPVGAIIPSPVGMSLAPGYWQGFPYGRIGRYSDVVLPMAYWSYRTTCPDTPEHCPYEYARLNTRWSAERTGLPVHLIGGVGNRVTKGEVADFVRGAKDEGPIGGSIYDYRTTKSGFWEPLSGFNDL